MKRIGLVTGGASGIGAGVAKSLANDGVAVVITDVNQESGAKVAAEIGGLFIPADLAERASCKRVVDETIAQYGQLDILVNNAGFQHIDPIPDFPEDKWDRLIAVMLTAPFLLTKYGWDHLIKSPQGRIVNISSLHGVVASPFKAAYISAKHGLIGLTRTAALEAGLFGLTVNAVCPAYVRTPLVDKQIADQARTRGITPEEVIEKVMLEPAAIKKMLEPEDIGNLVVFLCSRAAWGITGSVQLIDLGWTAR
jgi:3-hydroxybutyrate dehydrogenase